MNAGKLTNIIMMLTAVQMAIPKFGELPDMVITAVLMTAISIISIIRMKSEDVNKKGRQLMWLLVAAAFLGGMNDFFTNYLDKFGIFINAKITNVLRAVIGGVIVLVNAYGKSMFPSEQWKETKQKQQFYKQ